MLSPPHGVGSIQASRPLAEHCRYDLVLDVGGRLLRVQCKSASHRGGVVQVQIAGCRAKAGDYVRPRYKRHELDAVAAYCPELDTCYLLPAALVVDRAIIVLRLARPKNAQRAALHWATDYEFAGAVAQMVERRHGMAEATGSNPVSSTRHGGHLTIGAHAFRDRLGYYLEAAGGGLEIVVTRRGRPLIRVLPAQRATA